MDEKKLFDSGCFLPSWTEDVEQIPISEVHKSKFKDLPTLLGELAEIKQHIQDIRERQWILAKLLHYHNNNFAAE